MSQLGPQATHQAAQDAAAKLTIQHGSPQAALAWLTRRSWKIKFLIATVAMFTLYALVTTFADLTGLRQQRLAKESRAPSQSSCDRSGLSLEQRAACKVAQEQAREREHQAQTAKAKADYVQRRAEEKALAEEMGRQRDAIANKQATDEFARRLDAIASGQLNLQDRNARIRYRDETLAALVQLLATTPGHPAREAWSRIHNLRPTDALAVVTSEGKSIPGASPEAREQFEAICFEGRPTPAWRTRCAAALRTFVLRVEPKLIAYHLNMLVSSFGG